MDDVDDPLDALDSGLIVELARHAVNWLRGYADEHAQTRDWRERYITVSKMMPGVEGGHALLEDPATIPRFTRTWRQLVSQVWTILELAGDDYDKGRGAAEVFGLTGDAAGVCAEFINAGGDYQQAWDMALRLEQLDGTA